MSLALETGGADVIGPAGSVLDGSREEALTPDMPAKRALGVMLAACRREVAHHRAAALTRDDPEGIHDVRVSLRRLRAVLDLFRDVASDPDARWIEAEAGKLADALSPARDLQVFLFETAPEAPAEIMQVGGQLVDRRLADARLVLDSPRFIDFERRLGRVATASMDDSGESLVTFARSALDRCQDRVRRRGRGLSGLGAGRLHRLRLGAKKLRYAVDFLAPLFRAQAAQDYAEATAALQDVLGKMNDRRASRGVLGDIARAGGPSREVRRSCKRLMKRVATPRGRERRELKRAWKAFKRAEPFWRVSLSP